MEEVSAATELRERETVAGQQRGVQRHVCLGFGVVKFGEPSECPTTIVETPAIPGSNLYESLEIQY
eukprot:895646-Rhodomonas_salina.1